LSDVFLANPLNYLIIHFIVL